MNDLGYIRNPMAWNMMLCPMKRDVKDSTGFTHRECAYLYCKEPILRYGNIYMARNEDREEVFASHQAILDAGWRVD